HVLPPEQELLLASASEVFGGATRIFGYLNNADFQFPTVKDSEGNDVQLTHGLYGKLLESTDRRVRKDTFEGFYSVYQQFENTLAQTLTTEIKTHNYNAKARGFEDRKSTRLNSSYVSISYAVFCLKKKKKINADDKQYIIVVNESC